MALILNIDTALENGFVGLSENEKMIAWQSSANQKEHASFLQPAVAQMMFETGKKIMDIDAVAVIIGPGSYTGLRVGLASAKGFCYALQKPMITINMLETIALATIVKAAKSDTIDITETLFCSMIDARRMEVFTATYDYLLHLVAQPTAMILNEDSFLERLKNGKIVFSGNGTTKFKNICHHPNALFIEISQTIDYLAILAANAYQKSDFANIPYSEPFYIKAFHSTQPTKTKVLNS